MKNAVLEEPKGQIFNAVLVYYDYYFYTTTELVEGYKLPLGKSPTTTATTTTTTILVYISKLALWKFPSPWLNIHRYMPTPLL